MSDEYGINATITADDSGFQATFNNVEKSLSQWGLDLGKLYSKGDEVFKGFGVNVGDFAEKLGMTGPAFTALAGGIAIVGEKLFEIGKEFDEYNEKIAKTTGATGAALEGFNNSLKNIALSGVEQNLGDVSQAMATLSIKFGETGKPLEELTRSFSDFADVGNISVTQAVSGMSDVIKKWHVDTKDIPELLDQMTLASQKTGISQGELSSILTGSAAQLKPLGLSLTDSIALFSSFKEAGVNTSSVLFGLNTLIGVTAKSGGDLAKALPEAFDQIKNAKTPTEALTIAIHDFGRRAGPELANAITSGAASVDDLKKILEGAQGTVAKTGEASQSMGDKIKTMGNQLKAIFSPIGEILVDLVKIISDTLIPVIQGIGELIMPALENIKKFFVGTFSNIGSVLKTFVTIIKDIFSGNWTDLWIQVQLVVLEMAKGVLDTVSWMVNQVVKVINGLLSPINSMLKAVGIKPLGELQEVSLATLTGIDGAIKKLKGSLVETKDVNTDLGKSFTDTGTSGTTATGKTVSEQEKLQKAINDTNTKYALGMITYQDSLKGQQAALKTFIDALIATGDTNSTVLTAAVAQYKALGDQIDIINGKTTKTFANFLQSERDSATAAAQAATEAAKAEQQALLADQEGFLAKELANYQAQIDQKTQADIAFDDLKRKANAALLADQNTALLQELANYYGISLAQLKQNISDEEAATARHEQFTLDMANLDIASRKALLATGDDAMLQEYANYLGISLAQFKQNISDEEAATARHEQFTLDMANLDIASRKALLATGDDAMLQEYANYLGISLAQFKQNISDEEAATARHEQFTLDMANLDIASRKALLATGDDAMLQEYANYLGISLAQFKQNIADEEAATTRHEQFTLDMANLAINNRKILLATGDDALLQAYADYLGISLEQLKQNIVAQEAELARHEQFKLDMANLDIASRKTLLATGDDAILKEYANYLGISLEQLKQNIADQEAATARHEQFALDMANLEIANRKAVAGSSDDILLQAQANYLGISLEQLKANIQAEQDAINKANQLKLDMATLEIASYKTLLAAGDDALLKEYANYLGISLEQLKQNIVDQEAELARHEQFKLDMANLEIASQKALLATGDEALLKEYADYLGISLAQLKQNIADQEAAQARHDQFTLDMANLEIANRKAITGSSDDILLKAQADYLGISLEQLKKNMAAEQALQAKKKQDFITMANDIANIGVTVFSAIGGSGAQALNQFMNTAVSIAKAAATGFSDIGTDMSVITGLIGMAGTENQEKLTELQTLVSDIAQELLSALSPILGTLLDILSEILSLLSPLIEALGAILNLLKPIFDFVNNIISTIVNAGKTVLNWILGLFGIKTATAETTAATKQYIDALNKANSTLDTNKSLFDKASNAADAYRAILTKVQNAAASFYGSLANVGTDIASKLVQNLQNGLTQSDFLTTMKKYITDMVIQAAVYTDSLKSKVADIGAQIAAAVATGASASTLSGIKDKLSALYASASAGASAAASLVNSVFSGYATGTSYAPAGTYLVGEQGPELATVPQGTKILNAQNTAQALSGGNVGGTKSTVINANFYSPTVQSPYEQRQALMQYNRQLAFEGNL